MLRVGQSFSWFWYDFKSDSIELRLPLLTVRSHLGFRSVSAVDTREHGTEGNIITDKANPVSPFEPVIISCLEGELGPSTLSCLELQMWQ